MHLMEVTFTVSALTAATSSSSKVMKPFIEEGKIPAEPPIRSEASAVEAVVKVIT